MDGQLILIVQSAMAQILNLWFAHYVTTGMTKEEAAGRAWEHANTFLRECGMSSEMTDACLVPKERWVQHIYGGDNPNNPLDVKKPHG